MTSTLPQNSAIDGSKGEAPPAHPTIALVGNPNVGKSTLFGALSGVRQRVGNYPGVTVERKTGHAKFGGRSCTIVDLPGAYSLAPRSPDEMVAVDVLLGRRDDTPKIDAVICIVDASNLERNLYLVNQVLEFGLPTVLALNMIDVARGKGIEIDVSGLEKRLGIRVVEIQAHRKLGIGDLRQAISQTLTAPAPAIDSPFPEEFREEVALLEEASFKEASMSGAAPLPRYLCERLLLDANGYLERAKLKGVTPQMLVLLPEARGRLAEAGLPVPAIEAMSRYKWAAQVLEGVVKRPASRPVTASDKIDRLLTHKIWGTLIFAILMLAMFQAVYFAAEPASWAIDGAAGWLSGLVERFVPEGAVRSLLQKGVIEGVGGVLVFLPQIFTLFLFIAILEDCGYMARAAYLMDKLMSRVGLSGKSFIPLLSSFACAIPGIMSARVIENPRDRLVTMLVAPLMSCSARLPVYVLLTSAFIPAQYGLRGLTTFAMYVVGIVAAIFVAWVLKKTLLRGETPPFIMELPAYKRPSLGIVLHRMFDRGWAFVRRAGTLIFAMTIVIWAAGYYPRDPENIDRGLFARQSNLERRVARLETSLESPADMRRLAIASENLSTVNNEIQSAYLETSYLGRAGKWIEPIVEPLGWDWRIGCAVIASFPAREVVIGALGVIYTLGEDEEEIDKRLPETLRAATWEGTDRPVFNIPVALSLMVFFALCAQCVSTLAVMKRETNSWRWPIFTFVYMTALAYVAAFITYRVGMLFVS